MELVIVVTSLVFGSRTSDMVMAPSGPLGPPTVILPVEPSVTVR